jgi:hypothetical protein
MNEAVTYERAVDIPGLDPARRGALVEHIVSRNRALADRLPVSSAVSRCAAALLAADTHQRLSSPTALAQAEMMAQSQMGGVLVKLQESLMEMEALRSDQLTGAGSPRDALRIVLGHLREEVTELIERLAQTTYGDAT